MSKPRIPPTREGYLLWKEKSIKDVHVRAFAYTFKGIETKHICDQDLDSDGRAGEVQKFVYDILTKELSVTFSGTIQSGVVDALLSMIRESIKDVPVDDESPHYHTKEVSRLYQNGTDGVERYRIVGDVLVTNGAGPRFAIETAVTQSLSTIESKVQKWFLLPSMAGVLLIQLKEGNVYTKPTTRPRKSDIFLSSSWAWLNYIEDINEGIDLYDCSKPVIFADHVWFGCLTCVLELYERDPSSESSQCIMTNQYEFTVTGTGQEIEATEELEVFQERFSQIWREAINGDSLEGFEPSGFDWKQFSECISRTRLRQAYERYRAWFMSGSKCGASSLGKRRRDVNGS